MPELTPVALLDSLARDGGTTAEILALFDSLPPVTLDALRGRWRGAGLPSGHPMDGLLERFGWYGKRFDDPENVQPLLCRQGDGPIFPVNPVFVPVGLALRHPALFRTGFAATAFRLTGRAAIARRPTARLRMTEFRGIVTATMIYDRLPINDVFRAADANTLLGLMDMRDMPQPFFFVLRRETV